MRVLSCLAAMALFGCTAEPPPAPPPAAPASTAPPSARSTFPLTPPAEFVRDIGTSEATASAVQKDAGKALCKGLLAASAESIGKPLADDLEARWADEPLDKAGLVAALKAEASGWEVLERCTLKVHRFHLATDQRSAWARLELRLAGRRGGRAETARGWVQAELTADPWHFHRVELTLLERQQTESPAFTDISQQTGIGLRDDRIGQITIKALANRSLIETIGGVAVVDWDRDGRDDLLAWNRRRVLALFLNDGKGGFDRRADLLPPAAVGMFQLVVDLDGDGSEEVVSTELTGCTRGQREMRIYRRTDAGLAPASTLRFAGDCTHHRDLTYQHVAVDDIDADGDLDVFVSGYGNRDTNMGGYNKFDTSRGQRNLLFLNEGGLTFTEVSAARGISGTRFSYGATFFDHEGDGDPDLYVVNDYGPNALYINDGKGMFSRLEGTPLTRHGQSMGVTVGDFDGDLDLDVYVSNMFSKAGHRIVELVGDRMSETTRAELMTLAKGNALYEQVSPGTYVEVAQAKGLHQAGWAWGQAWFDHDNDGDRDLYVVNGMTSHDQIREHDY